MDESIKRGEKGDSGKVGMNRVDGRNGRKSKGAGRGSGSIRKGRRGEVVKGRKKWKWVEWGRGDGKGAGRMVRRQGGR